MTIFTLNQRGPLDNAAQEQTSQSASPEELPQEHSPEQDPEQDLDQDVHPTHKPYHSKRPHKKSRTGCRNCKTRKVKCDEGRPTCRSCRLRKVECVYPTPPPPSTKSTSPPSSSRTPEPSPSTKSSPDPGTDSSAGSDDFGSALVTQSSPGVIDEPLFRPGGVDSSDLRLLWFYTTMTAESFTIDMHDPSSETQDLLRVRMVQVAFETPFLMDSLFALSSLHMQMLNQPIDQNRALAYRARAFEGYRRAIEKADPESFPALIANSLFLVALSSQTFRDDPTRELYIIDWIVVWKGIGLVIDMMGVERLYRSGMHALFRRPTLDLDEGAGSIPNTLLFMITSIKPSDIDFADVEVYYETLKYLGSLYAHLPLDQTSIMGLRIITWCTFLPRRFVQLARERRPRALVIIAHYVVFLKMVLSVWWLEGIGQRSLDDICNYLGPEWQHLLAIPQLARFVHDPVKVGRLILQDPKWNPPTPEEPVFDDSAPLTMIDNIGRRVTWSTCHNKLVVLDDLPFLSENDSIPHLG